MTLLSQTFALDALSGGAIGSAVACAVLLAALAGVVLYLVIGMRRVRYTITKDTLAVRAPFWGRSIPRATLKLDEAKVMNLETDLGSPWKKMAKRSGIGLPGCRIGWFGMPASDKKGLLYLSDPTRVLWVPSADDFTLMMSTPDPAALLSALRGHAETTEESSFPMTPPSMAGVYLFGPLVAVLLGLVLLSVHFLVAEKSVTVEDDKIVVSGAFWSEEIPRSDLLLDEAKLVELSGKFYPTIRTGGLELFGYKEGWFTLSNGDKALLVVSAEKDIVYLPTSDGWTAMVSVEDGPALLALLRAP